MGVESGEADYDQVSFAPKENMGMLTLVLGTVLTISANSSVIKSISILSRLILLYDWTRSERVNDLQKVSILGSAHVEFMQKEADKRDKNLEMIPNQP